MDAQGIILCRHWEPEFFVNKSVFLILSSNCCDFSGKSCTVFRDLPLTVMQWHPSFNFISSKVWFKGLLKSLSIFLLTHNFETVAKLCPKSAHLSNFYWNGTKTSHQTLCDPNWCSYLKWKVNDINKTS